MSDNISSSAFKDKVVNKFEKMNIVTTNDNADLEMFLLFRRNFVGDNESIFIKPNADIAEKTPAFLALIKKDYFEVDIAPEAEKYVDALKNNFSNNEVMTWLSSVLLEHFDDQHVVCGILHIISHYPYSEVAPAGVTMACSALNYDDDGVMDFAIKAFENWNKKATIKCLEKMRFSSLWLKRYVADVIENLRNYGDD